MSIETESPFGETPEEDVACADCGAYRWMVGPLGLDGEEREPGDFVCRSCARARGWDGRFFRESYGRKHSSGPGNAVRFRTRSHDGKEVVRHHDGGRERWVYVHRLALFAWSPDRSLGDLWAAPEEERSGDPRTDKVGVHHDVPVGWLNTEDNLEWMDNGEHGRVEAERRGRDRSGRWRGRA